MDKQYNISKEILIELDTIVSLFKACKNPKNDSDVLVAIEKVDKYLKSICLDCNGTGYWTAHFPYGDEEIPCDCKYKNKSEINEQTKCICKGFYQPANCPIHGRNK